MPKGSLGQLSRRRFEALLRSLSGRRSEIARATEFALLRAEAADEVRVPSDSASTTDHAD